MSTSGLLLVTAATIKLHVLNCSSLRIAAPPPTVLCRTRVGTSSRGISRLVLRHGHSFGACS